MEFTSQSELLVWFTSLFLMYVASVLTLIDQIDRKQYVMATALTAISFIMLYGLMYLGIAIGFISMVAMHSG
jgi:hypothetical protein